MPLFTYLCQECEEITERLVMGDKDPDPMEYTPLACKHCGFQGGLRHVLEAPELKFKGIRGRSGFYSVDHPPRTTLGTTTKVGMSTSGKGGRDR
jgi:predicted nucleic acid-binding Zn ribbon protein